MKKAYAVLVLFFAIATSGAQPQQPPKSTRTGSPVSIVRSDASSPVTIEYRANNQWQQLRLEPGKDANVAGDRIRVATTREDKAIVTVDLPVEAGKKYRLLWNTQTGIWDFSLTN
ncbi:MAG TPA: hypothetical protein VFL57_12890 [Bryobacteraceae bacterium]|nr:hypothetical protein [Bryobacteraceae bacterium]